MVDTTKSEQKTKTEIIVIKETPLRSFIVDSTTYVLVVAVIGTGWWLNSPAMQWVGFIILGLCAIAVAAGKEAKKYTIPEARAYLDTLEKQ